MVPLAVDGKSGHEELGLSTAEALKIVIKVPVELLWETSSVAFGGISEILPPVALVGWDAPSLVGGTKSGGDVDGLGTPVGPPKLLLPSFFSKEH